MFRERESHLGVCGARGGGALTPCSLPVAWGAKNRWMDALLRIIVECNTHTLCGSGGRRGNRAASPSITYIAASPFRISHTCRVWPRCGSRCIPLFFSNHRRMKHVSIEAKSKIAGMLQQEMEFLTFFVLGTRMFNV